MVKMQNILSPLGCSKEVAHAECSKGFEFIGSGVSFKNITIQNEGTNTIT